MKYLFILAVIITSCQAKQPIKLVQGEPEYVYIDTLSKKIDTSKQYVDYINRTHSLDQKSDSLFKVIRFTLDSMKHRCDSLQTALFVAKYKIERVRYYWKIAVNKPSQRKFLASWLERALQY